MNSYTVVVEHPTAQGAFTKTSVTVEAKTFDQAVHKAKRGLPKPNRTMSVENLGPVDPVANLFEEA